MKHFSTFLLIFSLLTANAQQVITNIPGRHLFTLNGKWHYIIDPYETGYYDYRYKPYDESKHPSGGFFLDKHQTSKSELIEYNFNTSPGLIVPGDWNSQDNKLLYYEGSIWYRKLFDYKKSNPKHRVFVHFGAANYEADVYLNGQKLGKHIGGFTPFDYEITSLLKDKGNSLVVMVNNQRKRDGVPTLNTDWWNYGGITRNVDVVEVPETFIADYTIQLKKGHLNEIEGMVRLNGPKKSQKVTISIPEIRLSHTVITNAHGVAHFTFPVKKLVLWSPENPKLYNVTVSAATDSVSEPIGFRTIRARGTDILLNGKPIFLRGISIHEEIPIRGRRAYSKEDAQLLLGWAKELNCNYVRLAHYPHNENMVRLADKMGIMVWEENPVYWTILFNNPETYTNAEQQLTDEINRDKNRASVIIWSMGNETPIGKARNNFLRKLADHARSLDSTRLISAALQFHGDTIPHHLIVDDPFAKHVDVVSFNEYVGWYDGLPDKCDSITWDIPYNKPVIVSEFGGGAVQGMHGDTLTRWTEEFQASLYKHNLSMLSRIPQWRGVSPWILCDFRSPKRLLPFIQDGWNRKGLIGQNGTKKKAFYILQKFYKQIEQQEKK
ncbi:MAG: beta galactosidase jelly roll domain-containing protein [Bacteroidales bacterium]|nr:beta galactosidase jelly roll domain-containing protein [Bacteroidales bacterium]